MTQKNKPGKDMKSSIIRSYGYMPLCSSSKVVGRRRGIFVEGKRYRGSSSSYGRAHTRSVCRALLQFKLKSNCLIEWKGSDLSQEPRVILCPQLCHLIEEVIDVFILRLNLSVWPKVFFKNWAPRYCTRSIVWSPYIDPYLEGIIILESSTVPQEVSP